MIRETKKSDFKAFWPTFESVIKAQETYAFEPDMTFEEAYAFWCASSSASFVFEENGQILGSYFMKPNGMGPSSHICNCGYMISEKSRGKGIARKLCEHSQKTALRLGFQAMQFNAVVSTNKIAISLWQKLGYQIIGTVPEAYLHGRLGYVDTYIMHKQL